MHILVMHRVPDSFVRYSTTIDHDRHDVTYVSVDDRWATLPSGARARFLHRPGTGDTAEEVLRAVEGLPRPDLVIALSEYDLLPAARVRKTLGVAGPLEADVLPVRDKIVMKEAVAAAGLRVPRHATLPAALADPSTVGWTGPTVLKPLAGASSEGVSVLPGVEEALVAGAAHPATVPDHEIEEFLAGPIIHVDGLARGGRLTAVTVSRYVGSCLGYAEGRPLGSVQVASTAPVLDWTARCLAAVGVVEGPFHLEGIETADGLVFMEVGARFGGADVVDTFALATGVHLPSAQVRLLLGEPGREIEGRTPDPGAHYGWFVVPGHTLAATRCRVEGVAGLRGHPLVHRWVERTATEAVSGSITYADDQVPLAGVVGPGSAEELERFLGELFAAVVVRPLGVGPA